MALIFQIQSGKAALKSKTDFFGTSSSTAPAPFYEEHLSSSLYRASLETD
jgi:hypothetical protein